MFLIRIAKKFLSPTLYIFLKSLAYLFVVQCVLLGPAYAVTLCCFMVTAIYDQSAALLGFIIGAGGNRKSAVKQRTVLINGCTQTTSVHMARMLHSSGFRVVACDFPQNWLNPTRFSVAVDAYYTVPRPEHGIQEYIRKLCEIAKQEKVDVFLPVSTAAGAVFDALSKAQLEQQGCIVFAPSAEHVRRLSNKVTFFEHAARCGFEVPMYYKVTNICEIMQLYESGLLAKQGPFMLTSLRCNNKYLQDGVLMPRTIEEFITNIGEYDNYSCSLLLQQFIRGRRLTTATTIVNGKVVAHSSCYNQSPYVYDPLQTANTLAWIQAFVKMYPTKLTGNFIFNFVVSGKKHKLYPESCTSGIGIASMIFQKEKCLGQQMLSSAVDTLPLFPKNPQPLYWFYEELWLTGTTLPTISGLITTLWKLLFGHEAIFRFKDPLPFIALNHLHIPFLVFVNLLQRKDWTTISFCAGKLHN